MGLLHDAGLAEVFERDLAALNPLLDAMGQRGMPVDLAKRAAVAEALAREEQEALEAIRAAVPQACWPTKIYKRRPACDVVVTQKTVTVVWCAYCQARKPNKKHKCWKDQPVQTITVEEEQLQFVKLLPFVPSPKGLLTYFTHKGYTLPKKYDRATGERRDTTDEGALVRLALAKEDPVCALVLRYRDVQKQLGTYVGR